MIDKFDGEHSWLSNFYPAPVVLDGDQYPSVEHAYQAAKSLDAAYRLKVRQLPANAAKMAKRFGHKARLREDWNQVRLPIMFDLLKQKFHPTTVLAMKLIVTGDQELIEGNWWRDTFWGVCKGVGENNLGKLLMMVRKDLLARLK